MRFPRLAFLISAIIFICVSATMGQPSQRVLAPRMTHPAVVVLDDNPAFALRLAPGVLMTGIQLVGPGAEQTSVAPTDMDIIDDQTMSLILPAEISPGLYTINIVYTHEGDRLTETIARSVWIMKSAPERVMFAHLADTHTGDPRAAMSPSAEEPDERREKVLRAACASGVDFVIVTGDIVSVPGNYKKEYKDAFHQFEQFVSCPLFLFPGNHDQYTTHATKKSADGAAFWQRYFGDDKYAFSIGQFAFVAVNTYDWPVQYRNFMNQPLMRQVGSYSSGAMSKEQVKWLDHTLAGFSDKSTLVFGHHLFRDFSTKNSSVPELAAADDVLGLLAARGVKYYFAGHNHRNTEETVQGVTLSTVVSAASDIPDDASWGFRKCTAENDSVRCEFVSVVPRTD